MHKGGDAPPPGPPVLKGGRQGPGVRGKRGGLIYLKTCAIRRDVNRGEAGDANAVTAGGHPRRQGQDRPQTPMRSEATADPERPPWKPQGRKEEQLLLNACRTATDLGRPGGRRALGEEAAQGGEALLC